MLGVDASQNFDFIFDNCTSDGEFHRGAVFFVVLLIFFLNLS